MIVFRIIFLIMDCKLILCYVTFMLIYCCELEYYTFVYNNNNNVPFLYSANITSKWRLYALEALLPRL